MAIAAELRLADFNAQDLGNTVWAFATAGQVDVPLFVALDGDGLGASGLRLVGWLAGWLRYAAAPLSKHPLAAARPPCTCLVSTRLGFAWGCAG